MFVKEGERGLKGGLRLRFSCGDKGNSAEILTSELSIVGVEDATSKLSDKWLEAEAVDECRFRKGSERGKLNVGIRYVGNIRGVCCLVLDILAVVYRRVYMYAICLLCTV